MDTRTKSPNYNKKSSHVRPEHRRHLLLIIRLSGVAFRSNLRLIWQLKCERVKETLSDDRARRSFFPRSLHGSQHTTNDTSTTYDGKNSLKNTNLLLLQAKLNTIDSPKTKGKKTIKNTYFYVAITTQ